MPLQDCQAAGKQSAIVQEVLTGDSVRLEGGRTLKYAGLNAPSLHSGLPLEKTYATNSLEFNKKMVFGKKILIEWGAQIRDGHRNLLGYVFLEDGTFINEVILKAGQARLHITPPNLKYEVEFHRSELEARGDKKGLWEREPENPNLKNEVIGEKSTKIYYSPDAPELERIPPANWVKFHSRVEAKAASYRPCKNCSQPNE